MRTTHPSSAHPAAHHNAAVLVRHMIFGLGAPPPMGPRGVFRHDVCGRAQRIVHGIATMRATWVPSRFKSRRADTPLVGPVGCQKVVKSGARVGTPTVERVPRKRQYRHLMRGEFAHFVLACRRYSAPSPEGIQTPSLQNVAKCAFPKHVRPYTEGVDVGGRAPFSKIRKDSGVDISVLSLLEIHRPKSSSV